MSSENWQRIQNQDRIARALCARMERDAIDKYQLNSITKLYLRKGGSAMLTVWWFMTGNNVRKQ